jgi:ubiquinone/menaquinone biosynthesis C-methylase UbiE
MRSAADLRMRVCDNFRLSPDVFEKKLVLDAGCGAGDQSRYLISCGASVMSVDLSDAIELTARKLRLEPRWVGVQGDITALPIADTQFDIVYCEGVLQHTRDSQLAVKELARVARQDGLILARHYVRTVPKTGLHKLRRKLTQGYYDFLRTRFRHMDRYKRLLVTGNLAALSYVPVLRTLLRATATVMYYPLQGDFKTTWINTHDYYGGHEFQRFISPEEFLGFFEKSGGLHIVFKEHGGVVARKVAAHRVDL